VRRGAAAASPDGPAVPEGADRMADIEGHVVRINAPKGPGAEPVEAPARRLWRADHISRPALAGGAGKLFHGHQTAAVTGAATSAG